MTRSKLEWEVTYKTGEVLNLKDVIGEFVEFRHEVVVRRTKYELRKAEERAHILEGLIIASDNIDEVIAIIKNSKTPDLAIENLMERFNLSETRIMKPCSGCAGHFYMPDISLTCIIIYSIVSRTGRDADLLTGRAIYPVEG